MLSPAVDVFMTQELQVTCPSNGIGIQILLPSIIFLIELGLTQSSCWCGFHPWVSVGLYCLDDPYACVRQLDCTFGEVRKSWTLSGCNSPVVLCSDETERKENKEIQYKSSCQHSQKKEMAPSWVRLPGNSDWQTAHERLKAWAT